MLIYKFFLISFFLYLETTKSAFIAASDLKVSLPFFSFCLFFLR